MNSEIKQQWLEALRSGKYEQGKGELKTPYGGFCCLGVLCDLYIKANPGIMDWAVSPNSDLFRLVDPDDGQVLYNVDTDHLPQEVANWSGFDSSRRFKMSEDYPEKKISEWNDGGYEFDTISNLLEKEV